MSWDSCCSLEHLVYKIRLSWSLQFQESEWSKNLRDSMLQQAALHSITTSQQSNDTSTHNLQKVRWHSDIWVPGWCGQSGTSQKGPITTSWKQEAMLWQELQLVSCWWGKTVKNNDAVYNTKIKILKKKFNIFHCLYILVLQTASLFFTVCPQQQLTSCGSLMASLLASRESWLVPFRTCWSTHTIQVFRCPNAIGVFVDCEHSHHGFVVGWLSHVTPIAA